MAGNESPIVREVRVALGVGLRRLLRWTGVIETCRHCEGGGGTVVHDEKTTVDLLYCRYCGGAGEILARWPQPGAKV